MSAPVVYGRQANDGRFYWYCNHCKAYGYEELLSSVYSQGSAHWCVTHG